MCTKCIFFFKLKIHIKIFYNQFLTKLKINNKQTDPTKTRCGPVLKYETTELVGVGFFIITARCYASAVLAMGAYGSLKVIGNVTIQ